MSSVEQARDNQIKNIQTKTSKTLAELAELVRQSGLTKHGEIRDMLKQTLGIGFGDANTLTHYALQLLQSDAMPAAKATETSPDEVLAGMYTGAKAALRPIHDKLMTIIDGLGTFETAPKKGYISLRRKKQFVMIGPATNSRVEVGLNMKGVEATPRLIANPAGSMCQYTVKVTDAAQVDDELAAWLKQAYESAG